MTILRSVIITGIISILFGFAFRNFLGFIEATSLAFVVQFIISFIFSSLKINRVQNLTAEFEGELQQLFDLSEVTIACPCGNYSFTENIFLNVDNTYVCEKCNNEFKIDISITPTLLTQPIDTVKTSEAFTNISDEGIKIISEYTEGKEL